MCLMRFETVDTTTKAAMVSDDVVASAAERCVKSFFLYFARLLKDVPNN